MLSRKVIEVLISVHQSNGWSAKASLIGVSRQLDITILKVVSTSTSMSKMALS